MGFQDRRYGQQQQYGYGGGYGGGGMRIGMPPLTPVVKYLLIINVAVFVLQLLFEGRLEEWFAASAYPKYYALQVWRLVTFQFLHSTGMLTHILFNMIGLYFLGTMLERRWGAKRFLTFYLTCGVVGGALFTLASVAGYFKVTVNTLVGPVEHGMVLVGASGGVLGLLVACAVLFPHVRVILILFPVPIRLAAILFTAMYFLNVLRAGPNAGGDLCHLGGMATGFLWIWGQPYFRRMGGKLQQNKQVREHERVINHEREVDRILEKVSRQGLQSLTRGEKETLRRETEQQKRGR